MALLSPIALLVGLIAAMTGVGGGVFFVPLLSLAYGFSPHQAIGTSLAVIVVTSLSSSIRYWRQKSVDHKVGLVLALTTIPGAFVGAYLTSFVEEGLLTLIFGFFLVFVASRMAFQFSPSRIRIPKMGKVWHRKIVDSGGTIFEYDTNVSLGLLLSFFGGLSSGLLGVGGGSLMVPMLHLTMNFPMHVTVATSMFIMVFTSMSGAATHFSLGNVRSSHAVFLCIGAILGAQLGAYFSNRISGKSLRRMFGVVLFLVGVRMILKFM
jgi:uncharacterized membrane protein YfcA